MCEGEALEVVGWRRGDLVAGTDRSRTVCSRTIPCPTTALHVQHRRLATAFSMTATPFFPSSWLISRRVSVSDPSLCPLCHGRRTCSPGSGNNSSRSKRPGRRSAPSSESGRLVAPMSTTCGPRGRGGGYIHI